MDRLFTRALIDGDPVILQKAKAARGAWAEWKHKFFAQGKGDDAGRAIEKIVELDMQPQEVASMLYGGVAVGEKGLSVRLAMRLQNMLPQEAWEGVRAGAWLRSAQSVDGQPATVPQMLANRIDGFLSSNGKAMSEVLISAEGRAMMSRFAKAVRILVPPREATNTSNTTYGIARLVQDGFRSFASVLGFAEGGVSGGLGTMVATSVPGMVRGRIGAVMIPAKRAGAATQPSGAIPGALGSQQDPLGVQTGLR